MAQIAVTGVITATLFLRTHLHPRNTAEALLYQGALFYTLLVSCGCIVIALRICHHLLACQDALQVPPC